MLMRRDERPLGRFYVDPDELMSSRELRRANGKSFAPPEPVDGVEYPEAVARYSRRMFLRAAGVAALTLVDMAYDTDIFLRKQEIAATEMTLLKVYDAQTYAGRSRGVFVSAGFGNRNSYPTAKALPGHAERSGVYATVLDDAGIDTADIVARTAEFCRANGIRDYEAEGYSQGGLLQLAIARHLHEREDGPSVTEVRMFMTPSDVHTLRESSRDQGYTMVNMLEAIPDAEFSKINRYIVETFGARFPEIYRPGDSKQEIIQKFMNVSHYVMSEKITNSNTAQTPLLWDQFMYIVASGASEHIQALGSRDGDRVPPTIYYIRPQEAMMDNVVKTDEASLAFREHCLAANITYVDIASTGVEHANPRDRQREYGVITQVIDTLRPMIKAGLPETTSYLTFPFVYQHEDGARQHIVATVYPEIVDRD